MTVDPYRLARLPDDQQSKRPGVVAFAPTAPTTADAAMLRVEVSRAAWQAQGSPEELTALLTQNLPRKELVTTAGRPWFTPVRAWGVDGAPGAFVTCLACGAAVLLDRGTDERDPREVHVEWHTARKEQPA